MSPKAVKNRLKMVSQLWRLSIALGDAKKKTEIENENSLQDTEDKPIKKNK